MAKRKNKKEKELNRGFVVELKGILLVLISIIGFLGYDNGFGIAGRVVSGFATFITGSLWIVPLIMCFVIGGYIIIKREEPNFFTSKLIGLFIVLIGVLVLFHIRYIEELRGMDIITETIKTTMASLNNLSAITGGGIIGAIFSSLFLYLFDVEGTKIVSYVLIVCGTIMFTGITIYDIIAKCKDGLSKISVKDHKIKEQAKKVADDYEEETGANKVVVTSLDQLAAKEEDKVVITDGNNEPKKEESMASIISESPQTPKPSVDNTEETSSYVLPPITLLDKPKQVKKNIKKEIEDMAKLIADVLTDFGVPGCHIVAAHVGPAVTQYELEIKSGTKLTAVTGLNRELALALAAKDVRIEAPIPGKRTIGIEVPNKTTTSVCVREVLERVPSS